MKRECGILGTALVFFALACPGLALDPSDLLKVQGVDIRNLRGVSGDFIQAKKLLGEAEQINTGDAADYEGRIEYILNDFSQSLVFKIGECSEGYSVEIANGKRRTRQAILVPSIKTIIAGRLRLGMDKKAVESIFAEEISGGWKAEEGPRNSTIPRLLSLEKKRYGFQKTVISDDGSQFCDHLWITLDFDESSRLTRLDINSGGCDDSPCENH